MLKSVDYAEDVSMLVNVVPRMLDNVEAMANELHNAFEILSNTPKVGEK